MGVLPAKRHADMPVAHAVPRLRKKSLPAAHGPAPQSEINNIWLTWRGAMPRERLFPQPHECARHVFSGP
jgi:hypothetical protein